MESFIQGFNLEKSDNGTMYITTYLVRHGNARQVIGAYRLAHYLSFTTVLVKKETFSMPMLVKNSMNMSVKSATT